MVRKKTVNEYKPRPFTFEFLTDAQRDAWDVFQQSVILFLVGAAGTGKSFLATAFAIKELLDHSKEKIIMSRPVLEAGENLGFLPGDINEKIHPYMIPLYDCIGKLVGKNAHTREMVEKSCEVAPLAYLRGRSFTNAVCILDEAQNCTKSQLKLFLTRLGKDSRMIITGDPTQSDLGHVGKTTTDLMDVINKVHNIEGIGVVYFDEEAVVRHPIITQIIKKL